MANSEMAPDEEPARIPVILLVEDDVLVRFSTAELLREEGYEVLEAADAAEALALVATGRPLDLVLSDVRMPGEMDGVALTYAIKAVRPSLPMVLVSSHLPSDKRHAGNGFLAKPYRASDLYDLVRRMIGQACQNRVSSPGAYLSSTAM